MAPAVTLQFSSFALRLVLVEDKVNGTSLQTDIVLRMVLNQEKKEHVLDNQFLTSQKNDELAAARTAYHRARV